MAKSGKSGKQAVHAAAGEPRKSAPVSQDAGSMEKIRDILFGQQIREFEKRFAKLDEKVTQEAAGLRQELSQRLSSLEAYVKAEIEALNERLGNEAQTRADGLQKLSRELKEIASGLEKMISRTDDNLARKTKDLRQQILEQSRTLLEQINQKDEAASLRLDSIATELRRDKVERSDLAEYFSELSLRLAGDETLKSLLATGE